MRSLIAATLVFGLSLTPHAQESAAPALALGDTPGSWVADVATTGGYTGRGNGSISAIRTRQADGAATRTVYSWDNVDGPQLPAPVRAVYDTVMTAVRR